MQIKTRGVVCNLFAALFCLWIFPGMLLIFTYINNAILAIIIWFAGIIIITPRVDSCAQEEERQIEEELKKRTFDKPERFLDRSLFYCDDEGWCRKIEK